jgi:N-acetylneuraminic acid mutarotase
MRISPGYPTCLLLTLLITVAGCSDDGDPPAVDTGTTTDVGLDQAPPKDGPAEAAPPPDKGPPDGPRPPAKWTDLTGGPAVWGHTATLLKDGRVLITGGLDKLVGVDKLAEESYLYDPKAGTFSTTGKLKGGRYDHRAVVLDDGKVLVTGGRTDFYKAVDTVEIYDPAKGTWSDAAKLAAPRATHCATKLADGKVLVAGGFGNAPSKPYTSIEVYTPSTNSWSTLALKMSKQRSLCTATLLQNDKVLIAGGHALTTFHDTLEILDLKAGSLTELPSKMGKGRSYHTADRLKDGRVLLMGGSCGTPPCALTGDELFDPLTSKVNPISHSGPPPSLHATALLTDGRVLVVGGVAANKQLNKAAAFSTKMGGAWDNLPDMSTMRSIHTATTLADGKVLVVGGVNPVVVGQAELLTP